MKLQQQVAVITGAGRNIGKAMAKLFAAEGAKIAVVEMHEGRGQVVVQMCVAGTRDVAFHIGLAAAFRVGQGKTAVDDDPVRVVQMTGEIVRRNECSEIHGRLQVTGYRLRKGAEHDNCLL